MKNTARRMLMLVLSVALVCLLAVAALAGAPAPIVERAEYNDRYLVTADGALRGTSASAALGIYDEDTGSFVTNTYRYVKIEYSYYPVDGTQALVPDSVSKTGSTDDLCSTSVSTSSDPEIYLIRYATFTFETVIPSAGGTLRYSYVSDRLEYTPD